MKRPKVESDVGKTSAIADHQARKLLVAPAEKSLKGMRDRAILATLLYHALRREELCKLRVRDHKHERRGVPHLKVCGKSEKVRYVPLHGVAADLIADYLKAAGHEARHAWRATTQILTRLLLSYRPGRKPFALAAAGQKAYDTFLMRDLKRPTVFRPCLAVIINARCGDIGMAEPPCTLAISAS